MRKLLENIIYYPNGEEVLDNDLYNALDYMYGTDRDKNLNSYTDEEKQRSVFYWSLRDNPYLSSESERRKKLQSLMKEFGY